MTRIHWPSVVHVSNACLHIIMSPGSKVPGGASSTLDFMINRWLGVSGVGESRSASWLTVRGQLLTIDSTSHVNVRRDLLSSWLPLLVRRENRMEQTVLICLS